MMVDQEKKLFSSLYCSRKQSTDMSSGPPLQDSKLVLDLETLKQSLWTFLTACVSFKKIPAQSRLGLESSVAHTEFGACHIQCQNLSPRNSFILSLVNLGLCYKPNNLFSLTSSEGSHSFLCSGCSHLRTNMINSAAEAQHHIAIRGEYLGKTELMEVVSAIRYGLRQLT